MKVLWITNVLLPEIKYLLTGDNSIKMSGGWMSAMADNLNKDGDIDLYVASLYDRVKKVQRIEGESIHYYLLPRRRKRNQYDPKLESDWKLINNDVKPDVVHIHGTEFPYGLSFVNACGSKNVIVSIQGMPSEIYRYCKGGISNWEIIKNITLRDLLLNDSIFSEVRQMKLCGKYEMDLLGKVRHVIGRTDWDRIHTLSINNKINYHHSEELLRAPFYEGQWRYTECTPHTIFVSQAHCPLKGFHVLLKAVSLLKQEFPDIKIRVAGWNIFKGESFLDSFKQTGYAKYLKSIIKKNNLTDNVKMIGFLDADGIKNELLASNVYICPSSIENSPNSLCEAQILGVPCIASYVGGVPGFMGEAFHFLYRYDDWRYLSYLIAEVFKNEDINCDALRQTALVRHSQEANLITIKEIYQTVIEDE